MKTFETIRTVRDIPVGGQYDSYFAANKGYSITSDGPLVCVKRNGAATLVPWANVLFVTEFTEEPPKKGGAK